MNHDPINTPPTVLHEVTLDRDGIVISSRDGETFVLTGSVSEQVRAVLAAHRDQEVGRYRWPVDPDYVAYPVRDIDGNVREVRVLNERTGESRTYLDDDLFTPAPGPTQFRLAAADCFATYAPRLPWHDAKKGDFWLLEIRGRSDGMFEVVERDDALWFARNADELPINSPYILDAQCVWVLDK